MEAVDEKRNKVHHGRNVRLARTCQNITQEDLAFKINSSQSKISALELEETIDDTTLDLLAVALNVSLEFLKNFQPEDVIKSYTFNNEDAITVTAAENSEDAMVLGQGEQNITNYNYPIDDLKDLYERLLREKDKQIEELKARLK